MWAVGVPGLEPGMPKQRFYRPPGNQPPTTPICSTGDRTQTDVLLNIALAITRSLYLYYETQSGFEPE